MNEDFSAVMSEDRHEVTLFLTVRYHVVSFRVDFRVKRDIL